MSAEAVGLIIRIFIVFFSAAASEVALSKRLYGVALLFLGLWVTFFRLGFLRAATYYVGAFQHESFMQIVNLQTFLKSPQITNVTDGLVLVGVIVSFYWIVRLKKTGIEKGGDK